jgi:hypothetical protein
MRPITIHVPEVHRAELLHVLLGLYATKAEALYHTTTTYVAERGPISRMLADEAELRELRELVEQLGWRLDPRYVPRA